MIRIPRLARTLLSAAAPLALFGCRAAQPANLAPPPAPPAGNAALVSYLADQPFVPAEAAYRSVYVLRTGETYDGEYADLATWLETERIADPVWKYAPAEVIDRATAGYLVARACEIRTGLNWTVFGMGRYAWRELVYRGIAEPGNELALISSGEFLGLLTRAEDYVRGRRQLGLEPAELPAAPIRDAPADY